MILVFWNDWVRGHTCAFRLITNFFNVAGNLYFLDAFRKCVIKITLCGVASHFQVILQQVLQCLQAFPHGGVCLIPRHWWVWRLPSVTRWLRSRLVTTPHNIPRHDPLTHLLTESITALYHIFETLLSAELYWLLSNRVPSSFFFLHFIIILSTSCLGTDHKQTSLDFSYNCQA